MRLCKARIDSEGWPLTATYTDAAVSGAIRMRPGYQKLLEDARNDAFDIVIAGPLDQLSRDQEDVAALYKQSQLRRVTMLTLAEGERSELHVGLKGTMNALFLKDLAKKTWRGLEGRVRQGRSGGGICYGYDVIRELDVHREAVNGGRRINDLAAGVVRRIFAEYAPGARRAPSPRRSTATALPVRAASPGTPRPSMAIGAEAPASSTTSSMSAGWSGIACATRRTQQAAEALRALIDEIRLTSAPDGILQVELYGELGAILALGQDTNVNRPGDVPRRFSLVAGRGFEPLTFRL